MHFFHLWWVLALVPFLVHCKHPLLQSKAPPKPWEVLQTSRASFYTSSLESSPLPPPSLLNFFSSPSLQSFFSGKRSPPGSLRSPKHHLVRDVDSSTYPLSGMANASSTYVCSTIVNTTLGGEVFQCLEDDDCYVWDTLHRGANVYSQRSPYGFPSDAKHYACVNQKCVHITHGLEGANCSLPYIDDGSFLKAGCKYPYICASGICQLPVVSGCGSCQGDITACLPGTVCDTVTDQCSSHLQEGSQCIFKVMTSNADYNYETGTYEVANNVVDRWVDCATSMIDFSYDPTLYCDYSSGKCVRQSTPLQNGDSCLMNPTGCQEGTYCQEVITSTGLQYLCQPYAQEGEDCGLNYCAYGLECIMNSMTTRVCAAPGSLPAGSPCSTTFGSGYPNGLCQSGLTCNSTGVCTSIRLRGESCHSSLDCEGLYLCRASTCVAPFSLPVGAPCQGESKMDLAAECKVGSVCNYGVCTNVQNVPCEFSEQCGFGTIGVDSWCKCQNYSVPNGAAPPATCQVQTDAGAALVPLIKSVVGKCLYEVGVTLNDMMYLKYARHQLYLDFACCVLSSTNGSYFGDPWFTPDLLLLTFGYDNLTLTCNSTLTGYMLPKPTDICSSAPNLNFETGLQAMAGIEGAVPYVGTQRKVPQYTFVQQADPTSCGSLNCGGKGLCDGNGNCQCFPGFWGTHCEISDANRVQEREFLHDLFTQTRGCNWIRSEGWLEMDVDYCQWFGITCENFMLSQISLGHNQLRGTIPTSISQAAYLKVLKLEGNYLSGVIPDEIYSLSSLEVLDLSENYLQGELSESIEYLPNLQKLILFNNEMSGSLPWNLGLLSNLTVVLLQRNRFDGDLPGSLVNLASITLCDVSGNLLSNHSFLPMPICPYCSRNQPADGSLQGYLLSCASPRATPLHRNIPGAWDGKEDKVEAMWPYLETLPETCSYRYV